MTARFLPPAMFASACLWLLSANAWAVGPTIRHTPPRILSAEQDVVISAHVESPGGVTEPIVYVRAGKGDYSKFRLHTGGGSTTEFSAVIPRSFIKGSPWIEYYIYALDSASLDETRWNSDAKPFHLRLEPMEVARKEVVHKLTIHTEPDGGIIELDGATVGSGVFADPVKSGEHKLVVRLPGYQTYEYVVLMPSSRDLALTARLLPVGASSPAAAPAAAPPKIEVRKEEPPPARTAPAPPPPEPAPVAKVESPPPPEPVPVPQAALEPVVHRQPPDDPLHTLGIVAIAAGGAGLLAGTVLAIVAQANTTAIRTTPQPQQVQQSVNAVNALVAGATAGWIAGGVVAGVGVGLVVAF